MQNEIKKYIINITTECPTGLIPNTKKDYRHDIFGIIQTFQPNDKKIPRYFQFVIETDEIKHYNEHIISDITKDMFCIKNSISLLRIKIENEKTTDKEANIAIEFLKKIIKNNLPIFSLTNEYIQAKTNNYKIFYHDINLNKELNWIISTKLKFICASKDYKKINENNKKIKGTKKIYTENKKIKRKPSITLELTKEEEEINKKKYIENYNIENKTNFKTSDEILKYILKICINNR